jgi:hypothetical protein
VRPRKEVVVSNVVDLFAIDADKTCARCGITGEMYVRDVMNIVSRADEKTVICRDCGQAEAMGGVLVPWMTQPNPVSLKRAGGAS